MDRDQGILAVLALLSLLSLAVLTFSLDHMRSPSGGSDFQRGEQARDWSGDTPTQQPGEHPGEQRDGAGAEPGDGARGGEEDEASSRGGNQTSGGTNTTAGGDGSAANGNSTGTNSSEGSDDGAEDGDGGDGKASGGSDTESGNSSGTGDSGSQDGAGGNESASQSAGKDGGNSSDPERGSSEATGENLEGNPETLQGPQTPTGEHSGDEERSTEDGDPPRDPIEFDNNLRGILAGAGVLIALAAIAALSVRNRDENEKAATEELEDGGAHLPPDLRRLVEELDLNDGQRQVVEAYARARADLARQGRQPRTGQTPTEFARELTDSGRDPLCQLTRMYLAILHGDRTPSSDDVSRARRLSRRADADGGPRA